MPESAASPPNSYSLIEFDPAHALAVATWVTSSNELRWLAPSTSEPLTADKVLRWPKAGATTLVLMEPSDAQPVAYGELNPMARDASHLWIGHLIVRPDRRGSGLGARFTREIVAHAFSKLGATRISLVVFPANAAAIGCYLRAGFKLLGEEHHRFGSDGPLHRLVRLEIDGVPDADGKVQRSVSAR